MRTRHKVLLSVMIGLVAVMFGLWLRFGWLWDVTAGLLHPVWASFELRGFVVDEQGDAIEGVQFSIGKLHSYPPGADPISPDVERKIIDGYFEADVSGYAGIVLGFSKDGYYSERREFRPSHGPRGEARKSVVDRNIQVVMQKKGEPTKLMRKSVDLTIQSDGTGSVYKLDMPSLSGIDRSSWFLGGVNLSDNDSLPPCAIHLVVEETEQIGGVDGPHIPLKLTVVMTDPSGGFVPVHLSSDRRAERQMWSAPEGTDQPRLVASRHRLYLDNPKSLGLEHPPVPSPPPADYFYFQCCGLYGRGKVDPANSPHVIVREDGSWEAGITLQLQFQPDGSRNLEDVDTRL